MLNSGMNWNIDEQTATIARQFAPQVQYLAQSPQFQGRSFRAANWIGWTGHDPLWPPGLDASSPESIIAAFQAGAYLEGVALVTSWGTMWRQKRSILGNRPLGNILLALNFCAASIEETGSIDNSWLRLTDSQENGGLGWSAVMTSKTLHFLSRSLGHTTDPPVPIDNKIIRQKLWPHFVAGVAPQDIPDNWRSNSLEAYSRYMTAILVWSGLRNGTTTETENSLFTYYRQRRG